jgi:agmatine deiminase
MLRSFLLTITLCLIAFPAFAIWDEDGLEDALPIYETERERLVWEGREHLMPGQDRLSDPPPLAPVRNVAEWEPCSGVIIRYPLGIPYSLVRDLDDDNTVHVVVSSGYQSQAQSNLTSNGVDMSKVEFLVQSNDSWWTRDYGPWYVFDGNGEVAIIDHTYNRPYRPNDNLIPIYFANQQGIPVHSHDMYFTGGNYMTDGHHIGSSTELVYNEAWSNNGMNEAAVDQLVFDYYGVDNYMVLDYIESGGIHHIDTWAKFLDEETVLVKDVWTSHGTYDDLNQRATLLASLPSSTGRNYRVYRIYCYSTSSGPASYTNALINNNRIYVPTFGNSSYDNTAMAVYEEAAPGYEVLGYSGSWYSDDALHCRTKNAHDVGMLRVEHAPYRDGEFHEAPVPITAMVDDRSETGVSEVTLHYRFDVGPWLFEPMVNVGGDNYEFVFPAPTGPRDVITQVSYYIHAEDNSGRAEGMPRTEPEAWYTFDMGYPTDVETPAAGPVKLNANYPNPFNPKTTFSFELEYADQVLLEVFDATGRRVRTLIDGQCNAGRTQVEWNGRDDQGRELSSGVYLYRLRAAGIQYSRPAVLAK